jgi:predicted regulator of Ras-like GTPase activity (Roadblock/LC7/MglB family)
LTSERDGSARLSARSAECFTEQGGSDTNDRRDDNASAGELDEPVRVVPCCGENMARPKRAIRLEEAMSNPQMVMYEEEFNQIQTIVDSLVQAANSKVVFIIDKNGQLIAAAGDTEQIDTTSLASLTAGNIAATGGIAKLLRENEFATQFHEGEKANIHIQLVGNRVILVVIFDNKTSLGLVRLRVKKASEQLNSIFESLLKKVDPHAHTPFAEITDDDIDNLFND